MTRSNDCHRGHTDPHRHYLIESTGGGKGEWPQLHDVCGVGVADVAEAIKVCATRDWLDGERHLTYAQAICGACGEATEDLTNVNVGTGLAPCLRCEDCRERDPDSYPDSMED